MHYIVLVVRGSRAYLAILDMPLLNWQNDEDFITTLSNSFHLCTTFGMNGFCKYQLFILVLHEYSFPHFEYHIVHFFLKKLALETQRFEASCLICILYIVINFAFLLILHNCSQPV